MTGSNYTLTVPALKIGGKVEEVKKGKNLQVMGNKNLLISTSKIPGCVQNISKVQAMSCCNNDVRSVVQSEKRNKDTAFTILPFRIKNCQSYISIDTLFIPTHKHQFRIRDQSWCPPDTLWGSKPTNLSFRHHPKL